MSVCRLHTRCYGMPHCNIHSITELKKLLMATRPSASQVHTADHPALRSGGCWNRMRNGLWLGTIVGASIGGIYSGAQGLRYGLGGREFVRVVGKQMASVGVTFGIFMMIGAMIRCY